MSQIKSYNLNEAAQYLQISPATLRNWHRAGLVAGLKSQRKIIFSQKKIHELENKIKSGRVEKLRSRANKNSSKARHAHPELLGSNAINQKLNLLLREYRENPQDFLAALYILQLCFTKLAHVQNKNLVFKNIKIRNEMSCWPVDIQSLKIRKIISQLEEAEIDLNQYVLSYAYQFLTDIGGKQKAGAYYTPLSIVEELVDQVIDRPGVVLDPCCGSGHFMLAALKRLKHLGSAQGWKYVYGYDIDPTAVLIARAHLTLASRGHSDSIKQIRCCDGLLPERQLQVKPGFIVTNPPWGAGLTENQKLKLHQRFPQLKTSEVFSYFLQSSLQSLPPGGALGFVLPESFLNVKKHQDIRDYAFNNYRVRQIKLNEQKFSGVFTKTFCLSVQNLKPKLTDYVEIKTHNTRHKKSYADLLKASPFTITLIQDGSAASMIEKVEASRAYDLKNRADWALGIVTGNNKKFISNIKLKSAVSIIKGMDISPFQIKMNQQFILFKPDQLQQVAPLRYYRQSEKLVYRFIGDKPTFAIDRTGSLTLNSANVLIPHLPGYSLRAVCGILNSELAQVYFKNKFNSLKLLRSHLEQFPFPSPQKAYLVKIEKCVGRLEKKYSEKDRKRLNSLVYQLYGI